MFLKIAFAIIAIAYKFPAADCKGSPAHCDLSYNTPTPYCYNGTRNLREYCYGKTCGGYNDKGAAFCCRYKNGRQYYDDDEVHCCNREESCEDNSLEINECQDVWGTGLYVIWIILGFGMFLLPIIVLSCCFCCSSCVLYKYGRGRSPQNNTNNRSNVRYDRSGNIIMTISGTEQHQYTNVSPSPFYGTQHPPSYSEVQAAKSASTSFPQEQGQNNLGMVTDGETTLSRTRLPEEPPAYDSIQPTNH